LGEIVSSENISSYKLEFIKKGYESKQTRVQKNTEKVILKKKSAFLEIHSDPSDMNVYLDGVLIGKTPIQKEYPTTASYVELKISGNKDYKPYTQILDLDPGSFVFDKANPIKLEKDHMEMLKLLFSKKTPSKFLLDYIKKIPSTHSDLLEYKFHSSNYLLTHGYYNEALPFLEELTEENRKIHFRNKKFSGAHLMHIEALAHLTKSNSEIEKISKLEKEIDSHFIYFSKSQRDALEKNLKYNKALSKYNFWAATQNGKQEAIDEILAYQKSYKEDAKSFNNIVQSLQTY
jgi:hypothetical protein